MSEPCACGCGRPPVGSFWATDLCMANWIRKLNDDQPPVRTFCGSTYTETPLVEPTDRGSAKAAPKEARPVPEDDGAPEPFFPVPERELREASLSVAVERYREQVDSIVEEIQRGWLGRWLYRMFGRAGQ